jgi:alternative sigma factor RpoH
MRLVAKIAMRYRGYGLPIADIISEGNVGLMRAVKRFEPQRGFRLAIYAMWWIKASIHEYILRSWSLVKMGTSAAQKKLFFKLRRTKAEISALEDGDLSPEHTATIAKRLGVQENDVVEMNRRLGGDVSLNTLVQADEGAKFRTGSSIRHPVLKPRTPSRRKPNIDARRSPGPWKSSTRGSDAYSKRGSCPNNRSGLRISRHDLAFHASGCGRSKFAQKFGRPYAPA